MGKKGLISHITWQQGIEFSPSVHHQRVVGEAIGMVIHETSVKEERAVLRLRHKLVPCLCLVRRISSYFEHPTYSKNSSYS